MRWFASRRESSTSQGWTRTFGEAGIVVARNAIDGQQIDSDGLTFLLAQLEDDGYAEQSESTWRVDWDALYALLSHPEYGPALEALRLPKVGAAKPCLISRGALTDPDFSISIQSWLDADDQTVA